MRVAAFLLFVCACVPTEKGAGDPAPASTCAAPDALQDDPLVRVGATDLNEDPQQTSGQAHLTRVVVDRERSLLLGAAYYGLAVVDISGDTPDLVGAWRGAREALAVAQIDATTVAVSNLELGVAIVDVADPEAPAQLGAAGLPGASGMAAVGDRLYVLTHQGELATLDVADPAAPVEVNRTAGLGTPWAIVVRGDRAYVADATLGVVAVDLSVPDAPRIEAPADPGADAAGVQDLVVDGDWLYAAAGGAGVDVYALDGTAPPALAGHLDVGGSAIGVSARDGLLAVATQENMAIADVRDPAHPQPLATEASEQWAMQPVVWGPDRVVLAEWNIVSVFTADLDARAPAADPVRDAIVCPGPADTVGLANRGGAPLHVTHVSVDDPRLAVTVDRDTVPAGESATLSLTFADDGDPVDATVCIATDDPDQPVRTIAVGRALTATNVALCAPAPTFSLPDLAGDTHTLSAARGRPVLLAFFSTWCPICPSEITDMEARLWRGYADRGVEVWGIASSEDPAMVATFADQMGLTFPVLLDSDGAVLAAYEQARRFTDTAYPQTWVVGAGGDVVYVENGYDPDALAAVLEGELGG